MLECCFWKVIKHTRILWVELGFVADETFVFDAIIHELNVAQRILGHRNSFQELGFCF
jgi:hypothetical protein